MIRMNAVNHTIRAFVPVAGWKKTYFDFKKTEKI